MGVHVVVQVLLALLAAWGLVALGWLLLGKLLTPDLGDCPVYAVVPADGDGAGLEHTVKGLLWLRGNDWTRCTIVIADGGLDPAAQYRLTISYDSSRYYLYGMFKAEGIVG